MSDSRPDIAFVVPCYNEAENIEDALESIRSAAIGAVLSYEIIVIDDASTDATEAAVSRFQAAHPDVAVKLFRNSENRGSGYCHKYGASLSSAKYYSIIPGDNDLPAAAISAILAHLGKAEVLIPYPRPEDFRDRPFLRRVISKIYTLLVRLLSGHRLHYFHSPAVYQRRFVVEAPQNASGFGYYAELLCEALDRGYSYKEFSVPANYRNEQETSAFRLKNVVSVVVSILRLGRARAVKIMRRSIQLAGKHRLSVLLALSVGAIYFLPNILIPAWQAPAGFGEYHPLSLEAPTLDEVAAYGGRLREVMDGHFADGDAYLAEYKNRPTMWGSDFMAVMLGTVPFLAHIQDPTLIYVFGDFVFPAAALLLAYWLFFSLTKHRLWSALSGLLLIAFPNLSAYRAFIPPSFYKHLSFERFLGVFERVFDPSFSRLFVPGFSFLFFVFFLFAVFRALSEGSKRWLLAAAAAFGALFYVYFYYWAFAVVFLALLIPLLFFVERSKVRRAIAMFVGGFALSIPYWIKVWTLRQNPLYEELSRRVGLEISHAFRAGSWEMYLAAAALIALAWLLAKKRDAMVHAAVLTALLASIAVVLNIQVVTGFNIQPDHWGSRVNAYVLMLALMTVLFWCAEWLHGRISASHREAGSRMRDRRAGWERRTRVAIVGALLFYIGIAVIFQARSAMMSANDYRIPSDTLTAFRWVNQNIPKDSVFLSSSSKTTFYLPFFTHGNVFVPPACYTLASHEEIADRFLTAYAAFGVPEAFFRKSLESNLGDGKGLDYARKAELDPIYMLFCDYFAELKPGGYISGNSLRPFPKEVSDDLLARYRAKLRAGRGRELVLPYRADYIFFGPYERLISTVSPAAYRNLRLIFSQNLVEIYEFVD
ncbi:MAG: glycosyltransferase family 2 protein [Patescibacteria group bacterium]